MYLTLCEHNYSVTSIIIRLHKKVDLLETKVNVMKDREVCADENKLLPGKEWMPYPHAVILVVG